MAKIKINFFKVVGLPSEPEANAIYFIENDDSYQLYVTNADGVPKLNSTIVVEKCELLEISTDQDDLELGSLTKLNNSSGSLKTISGISGGTSDLVKRLINVGENAILLDGENTDSMAINRFAAAYLLHIGTTITIIYNGISSRWEVFS